MMMPSIFGENLFDEMIGFPFEDSFFGGRRPLFGKRETSLLKTDIRERNGNYELEMELPGYQKEDVSASLENGYLTISAEHNSNKEEKDEKGNYIRRERFTGRCQRTFYVGEHLKEEDIKAKFENGVLHLTFPKEEPKKEIPEKKTIMIEG